MKPIEIRVVELQNETGQFVYLELFIVSGYGYDKITPIKLTFNSLKYGSRLLPLICKQGKAK